MTNRILFPVALAVAATFVVAATLREARHSEAAADVATRKVAAALPTAMAGTSRDELMATVITMTERLRTEPGDAAAVVALANALIRLQRVNNDGRAVILAEQHLLTFLARQPEHYEALRMLAAVLLSQHRYGDAVAQANRAMAIDPRDAWNYGAAGDGYMELGDYPRAFEAFDRMGRLQPGPPAYARTSYALEIQGDLDGALEYMRRAADGTSPNDAESQAWHYVQVGELLVQLGRHTEARIEFERADATFPGHPLAITGRARIKVIDGDLAAARLMLQTQLAKTATPDLASAVAELSDALGEPSRAAQYHQMAEQIERGSWESGSRQPQVLAKLLAERPGRTAEAVSLAEEAARGRADILTLDTLAWAYFKNGQLAEAQRASAQAMRTGTRNARIRCHAAAIAEAAQPATSRAPAATRRCLEWHR